MHPHKTGEKQSTTLISGSPFNSNLCHNVYLLNCRRCSYLEDQVQSLGWYFERLYFLCASGFYNTLFYLQIDSILLTINLQNYSSFLSLSLGVCCLAPVNSGIFYVCVIDGETRPDAFLLNNHPLTRNYLLSLWVVPLYVLRLTDGCKQNQNRPRFRRTSCNAYAQPMNTVRSLSRNQEYLFLPERKGLSSTGYPERWWRYSRIQCHGLADQVMSSQNLFLTVLEVFSPKWFSNFGWLLNYASCKKDKQDKTAGRYTINHWDRVNSSSRISRGEKIPQKSIKSYRKETGCPAVTGSTGQDIRKLYCQCSQAMCHCQRKISSQQHQGSISISCKCKCLPSWLITASLEKNLLGCLIRLERI